MFKKKVVVTGMFIRSNKSSIGIVADEEVDKSKVITILPGERVMINVTKVEGLGRCKINIVDSLHSKLISILSYRPEDGIVTLLNNGIYPTDILKPKHIATVSYSEEFRVVIK